jgi:hypothetical protein
VIYANNNRGYLPTIRDEWKNPRTYDITNNMNYIWTNGDTLPAGVTADKDPGSNVGRLITTKAVSSTGLDIGGNPISYCPAASKEVFQNGTETARFNYYYNVHVKLVTLPSGRVLQRWWPRLASYGRVPKTPITARAYSGDTTYQFPSMPYALASDPIYDMAYATHANGRSRSWNLLYADGSVRIAVADERTGRAAGGNGLGAWTRYLDMVGYLERLADGQQVTTPPSWNSDYNIIPVDPSGN